MSTPRPTIDDFLRDLHARLNAGAEAPPALVDAQIREVALSGDLIGKFAATARTAGAIVHSSTSAEWPAAVGNLLATAGARRVRIEIADEFSGATEQRELLLAECRTREIANVTSVDAESLFALDAAVTVATAAIAETGSVVCVNGPDATRSASLVPPLHVVLLPRERIVADLIDYFGTLAERAALPTNINLVTGPSKTADIEGILVTGVHGPGVIHIVVF